MADGENENLPPETLAQQVAGMRARLQDGLRRIGKLEDRKLGDTPGANDAVREIAEQMLDDRIGTIESQVTDVKKLQTRMLWLILVSVAGQLLKTFGPNFSVIDVLKP